MPSIWPASLWPPLGMCPLAARVTPATPGLWVRASTTCHAVLARFPWHPVRVPPFGGRGACQPTLLGPMGNLLGEVRQNCGQCHVSALPSCSAPAMAIKSLTRPCFSPYDPPMRVNLCAMLGMVSVMFHGCLACPSVAWI